jgi:hypothetical protein
MQINCDRCGSLIRPEDGRHILDESHNQLLVCQKCDGGEIGQDMDIGLVRLLLAAGWLDADLRPTAKLLSAAKKYAAATIRN